MAVSSDLFTLVSPFIPPPPPPPTPQVKVVYVLHNSSFVVRLHCKDDCSCRNVVSITRFTFHCHIVVIRLGTVSVEICLVDYSLISE